MGGGWGDDGATFRQRDYTTYTCTNQLRMRLRRKSITRMVVLVPDPYRSVTNGAQPKSNTGAPLRYRLPAGVTPSSTHQPKITTKKRHHPSFPYCTVQYSTVSPISSITASIHPSIHPPYCTTVPPIYRQSTANPPTD